MVNIRYLSLNHTQGSTGTGSLSRWFLLLAGMILFAGCASTHTPAVVEDRTATETPQQPPEPQLRVYKLEEPQSVEPEPLPDTSVENKGGAVPVVPTLEKQSSPAVVALLDDADHYVVSGKKKEAVASIERALRIEPKNPVLWHKLGQLHLQEGKWEQAIAVAKKSNFLAASDRSLLFANWMIIAKARDAQGDKQGAAEAFNTANKFRY